MRELFAAVRFQAVGTGQVTFHFSGTARRVWLNGKLTSQARDFSVEAREGVNTLVLELNATTLPDAIRLTAEGAAFLTE